MILSTFLIMRLIKIIPLFVLILIIGCGGEPKLSERSDSMFGDLAIFIEDNFSDVTESEKMYDMLGATMGASFKGKDLNIEAYHFESKEKVKEGLTKLS